MTMCLQTPQWQIDMTGTDRGDDESDPDRDRRLYDSRASRSPDARLVIVEDRLLRNDAHNLRQFEHLDERVDRLIDRIDAMQRTYDEQIGRWRGALWVFGIVGAVIGLIGTWLVELTHFITRSPS